MEVLIFQKEAFEEMAAKFSRFSDRVNELLAKQGGKSLNRWMDNQEVCRQLNISPRTLQTLRSTCSAATSARLYTLSTKTWNCWKAKRSGTSNRTTG